MTNKKIGFCVTGSFCTFDKTIKVLKNLAEKGNIITPVFSHSVKLDTRFYKASDFYQDVEEITKNKPITTIVKAEPIGPQNALDLVIIAPCTGNTLAKLAAGITDTPVLMAAKAHLRNNKPLLICVSSNDAMSANYNNLAALYNRKNIFFVPFTQDDYIKKKASLVADFEQIELAAEAAISGIQLQPVLIRNF